MKVLVTGSSGFLAQHIIPELQESGYFVIGVDKRPEKIPADYFIQTDVADLMFKDLIDVDFVVHLAWRTNIQDCERHPVKSTEQNLVMTTHLLQVCKEAHIKKFIFPSTASLYSNNPTPWVETMQPEPIEHYSWQKLSCEYLCQMSDIPTVVPRFFQVFGEYQREDTVLAVFAKLKKAGKPVTLMQTAPGSAAKSGQRDFIYAGDLAKAIVLFIEKDTGDHNIYNVAMGEVTTIEEVAEAVGGEVKWVPRREVEVDRHHGNIDKLTALGWRPKVKVIDWIHENM